MPAFNSWITPRTALSKGTALTLSLLTQFVNAQNSNNESKSISWTPAQIATATVGCVAVLCLCFCCCGAGGRRINANAAPTPETVLLSDLERGRVSDLSLNR